MNGSQRLLTTNILMVNILTLLLFFAATHLQSDRYLRQCHVPHLSDILAHLYTLKTYIKSDQHYSKKNRREHVRHIMLCRAMQQKCTMQIEQTLKADCKPFCRIFVFEILLYYLPILSRAHLIVNGTQHNPWLLVLHHFL